MATYVNYDEAFVDDGLKLVGTDPWYHRRATEYIVKNKAQLIYDPLMDYPRGAFNPWPPLFDWVLAVPAMIMEPFVGRDAAINYSLAFIPSILGALCIIGIYFLGKELFDKRTGLIASILLFLMPAFTTRIGLGRADHDAIVLLMTILTILFFVKSIKAIKRVNLDWRLKSGKIRENISTLMKEEKRPIAMALVSGVFMGLFALTWTGYIYIVGTIIIYLGIQMVVDHVTRKDSSPFILSVIIILGTSILIMLPWYLLRYSFGASLSEVGLGLLILAGTLAISAIFLVFKRLPSIVFLPSLAGIGGLAAYLLSVFYPVPINMIVRKMPYFFGGTKLYQTIGEAQPPEFSYVATSLGILVFLMGFGALAWLFYKYWKERREKDLFMITLGIITIYMMASAVRFVYNASLVFALLGAWSSVLVLEYVDFPSMIKGLRGRAGIWQSIRRSVKVRHIMGVVFGIGLIAPNVYFSIDVAIPGARDDGRFSQYGAFQMGYMEEWWWDSMRWLRDEDSNVSDAERPGAITWWDYGHYIMELGEHPAIANPAGQQSYQYAGLFLLAQNETEALQLLLGRSLWDVKEGEFEDWLDELEIELSDPEGAYNDLWTNAWNPDDGGKVRMRYVSELSMEDTVKLIRLVEEKTGESIQYFITDLRLLTGTFHAPVKLTDRNLHDYNDLVYISQTRFGTLECERERDYVEMTMEERSGKALIGASPDYTDEYVSTLLYRAFYGYAIKNENYDQTLSSTGYLIPQLVNQYVSVLGIPEDVALMIVLARGLATSEYLTPNDPMPCLWMKHFRVVYNWTADGETYLTMARYYPGATVKGRVALGREAGESGGFPGATVVVFDDYGIPHDYAYTDQNGNYNLTAPFSLPGENVTIRVYSGAKIDVNSPDIGGMEVGNTTFNIPYEKATPDPENVLEVNIPVRSVTINGTIYWDRYPNGEIDDNDTLINDHFEAPVQWFNHASGTWETWKILSITTGDRGEFSDIEILPGVYNITSDYYKGVLVVPATNEALNVTVVPKDVLVNGTLEPGNETAWLVFDPLDGDPLPPLEVDENGNYSVDLQPYFKEDGYLQPYRRYFIGARFDNALTNQTCLYAGALNLTVGISENGIHNITRDITLLENVTISGNVTLGGEGIEGAKMDLFINVDGTLLDYSSVSTLENGTYNASALYPGEYCYKAEYENETGIFMDDGKVNIAGRDRNFWTAENITLSRAAKVTGNVGYWNEGNRTNATHIPVEFVRDVDGIETIYSSDPTNSFGNYSVDLPGNCTYTAKARYIANETTENETRYVNTTQVEVTIKGNETLINGQNALNITLEEGAWVRGNVTCDNKDATGAIVGFIHESGASYITATDTNGRYVFPSLPRGNYTYRIYKEGEEPIIGYLGEITENDVIDIPS